MANDAVAKDLARIKKALDQRTERWGPVMVTLLGAEDKALRVFNETSILRKPYTAGAYEKNRAFNAAFTNTRLMGTVWAPFFPGWLFGGLYEGLFYFTAIFKNLEGYQQERFRPDLQYSGLGSFGDVWGRVKRLWKALSKDLDRLSAAVISEQKEMPTDHAANALATMLLSPILYAPKMETDVDELARRMEWYMWLRYVPHVLDVLGSDVYRVRARDEALADLDPMFARLQAIAAKGTDKLVVPDVMKDLKQFRALLENRKIKPEIFTSAAPFEIDIPVPFPAGLKAYLAAEDEGKRKIVRGASQAIKWSEASL
jgi:hypothetical protein